jgi:hypothetical protein
MVILATAVQDQSQDGSDEITQALLLQDLQQTELVTELHHRVHHLREHHA